eukprot:RCo050271
MKMAVNTAKLLKNVPLPDEITQVHDNAVVIDTGSSTVKAGFSGDDCPRIVVPTCTGAPKTKGYAETVACNVAFKQRLDLEITWPFQNGLIMNWDSMEKIWEHLYTSCLKVQPDDPDTPVLLSEAALTPRESRDRMCQIFFEKLRVPALYVSVAPVLALYSSGRTTGIVVEAGQSTCHTVPIFEGYSLYHSILQLDFGGQDLTTYLRDILRRQGIRFPAPHEKETCGFLKETLCSVALDYSSAQNSREVKSYTMPDGTKVELGPERFTCCEALFNPSVIGVEKTKGVHATAIDSIRKCDADIMPHLYGNVVLAGGTTMFSGMPERLHKEMADLAPAEKVKVFAATERKYATWIGGSILASLPTFQEFWIKRADYEESGTVVHRNCF